MNVKKVGESLIVDWYNLPAKAFVLLPRFYYHCQWYGHMTKTCHLAKKGLPVFCQNCGEVKHDGSIQCVAKWVNCGVPHAAFSKGDWYVFELEVLALQAKDKLSFKAARERVLSHRAHQGMFYASLLKKYSFFLSHDDARIAASMRPS